MKKRFGIITHVRYRDCSDKKSDAGKAMSHTFFYTTSAINKISKDWMFNRDVPPKGATIKAYIHAYGSSDYVLLKNTHYHGGDIYCTSMELVEKDM